MSDSHRWRSALVQRFTGREELVRKELYHRYFSSLGTAPDSLVALFDFVEDEFRVPVGLLRPEDTLALLFDPAPSRGPLGAMISQAAASDKRRDLSSRLDEKLRAFGTREMWADVPTFGALVRTWVGAAPDGQE